MIDAFSSWQSNWFYMGTGQWNLILIKTCYWPREQEHWLTGCSPLLPLLSLPGLSIPPPSLPSFSPSTMRTRKERWVGRSSSSTITSWRPRSQLKSSERTMWVYSQPLRKNEFLKWFTEKTTHPIRPMPGDGLAIRANSNMNVKIALYIFIITTSSFFKVLE